MLAPKKVKFRKMMKGRMRGKAYRGDRSRSASLSKGAGPGCDHRQIEAARSRSPYVKRGGHVGRGC